MVAIFGEIIEMKKFALLIFLFLVLSSHDMFLKMDSYFLKSGEQSLIKLYNGTFDKSDNVVTRDRMVDVSLVGLGKRTAVDTTQWSEKDSMTLLNFLSGAPGTWVAGVSIRPKQLAMKAADFNHYLEHDGVTDMMEWRKNNDALEKNAVEEYSKHVKTIFQVGDQLTEDFKTVLGYPIEFVPMQNPYEMHPGHVMDIQLLWQGKPLVNQLVYMGIKSQHHEHSYSQDHSHSQDHKHEPGDTSPNDQHHDHSSGVRTDENGVVSLDLKEMGIYYLRTIHLVNSEKEGLTHESNWATLTFEIGEGHGHSHVEDIKMVRNTFLEGSWIPVIASVAVIIGLFFWFSKSTPKKP